jgi:hypothetical protein
VRVKKKTPSAKQSQRMPIPTSSAAIPIIVSTGREYAICRGSLESAMPPARARADARENGMVRAGHNRIRGIE